MILQLFENFRGVDDVWGEREKPLNYAFFKKKKKAKHPKT